MWVEPPEVPPPDECPPRFLPELFRNTIMDSIEVRTAQGRTFEEMDGTPGSPDSALWARVPGHLTPSAATLAIVGDYVSGAVSQPIGRRAMGRSLDNTLRMVQLKPTEWVLCDIRIHALVGGYAQGIAFLWSEDGELLATASQSIARASVAGGRRPAPMNEGAMTIAPGKQRDWFVMARHADSPKSEAPIRAGSIARRRRRRRGPRRRGRLRRARTRSRRRPSRRTGSRRPDRAPPTTTHRATCRPRRRRPRRPTSPARPARASSPAT